MKKSFNIEWDILGAELANLSDSEQANFFHGFAKELDSWPSHYVREMQMVSINLKLDDKVRDTLEKYLSTIFLRKD